MENERAELEDKVSPEAERRERPVSWTIEKKRKSEHKPKSTIQGEEEFRESRIKGVQGRKSWTEFLRSERHELLNGKASFGDGMESLRWGTAWLCVLSLLVCACHHGLGPVIGTGQQDIREFIISHIDQRSRVCCDIWLDLVPWRDGAPACWGSSSLDPKKEKYNTWIWPINIHRVINSWPADPWVRKATDIRDDLLSNIVATKAV